MYPSITLWQVLDGPKGPTSGDNAGPLRFEYGLSISQQISKATKCTVTWKGRQLQGAPNIKREVKSGGTFITVEVEYGPGFLEIEGDQDVGRQLPLAEHYGTMTNLRLVLKTARIKPPPATLVYDAETISSHLKVHLKGNETLNIQDRSAKVGKEDRNALEAEYQTELANLEDKRAERERLYAGHKAASKAAEAIKEELEDAQRRYTAALKGKAQWETAMFAADDQVKEVEKRLRPSIRRKLE
ncbi:hypothetical protein XPA_010351 [Xanthoria parietina]